MRIILIQSKDFWDSIDCCDYWFWLLKSGHLEEAKEYGTSL